MVWHTHLEKQQTSHLLVKIRAVSAFLGIHLRVTPPCEALNWDADNSDRFCPQFFFLRFLQLVAFQISSYYNTGSFRFASQFTLHYRVMLASVEYFQLILELKLNLGLTDVMA